MGKFDQFSHVLMPWLSFTSVDRMGCCMPFRSITGRVAQNNVNVTTKTKGNIVVRVDVAIQQSANKDNVMDATYKFGNVTARIDPYVSDVVRPTVPHFLERKDNVSNAVQEMLRKEMAAYGFVIQKALVIESVPNAKVVQTMNETNKQKQCANVKDEHREACSTRERAGAPPVNGAQLERSLQMKTAEVPRGTEFSAAMVWRSSLPTQALTPVRGASWSSRPRGSIPDMLERLEAEAGDDATKKADPEQGSSGARRFGGASGLREFFDDADLREHLLRGIYSCGVETLGAIQRRGIKPILDDHDTIGQAQSRTGKTVTFTIGVLQRLDPSLAACQGPIAALTRESANQTRRGCSCSE